MTTYLSDLNPATPRKPILGEYPTALREIKTALLATFAGAAGPTVTGYREDEGTLNSPEITLAAPELAAGTLVRFRAAFTNDAAATLTVNHDGVSSPDAGSLEFGDGGTPDGMVEEGGVYEAVYNGTEFVLVGSQDLPHLDTLVGLVYQDQDYYSVGPTGSFELNFRFGMHKRIRWRADSSGSLAMSMGVDGDPLGLKEFTLELVNANYPNNTLTWPTNFLFSGGGGSHGMFRVLYDGANYYLWRVDRAY